MTQVREKMDDAAKEGVKEDAALKNLDFVDKVPKITARKEQAKLEEFLVSVYPIHLLLQSMIVDSTISMPDDGEKRDMQKGDVVKIRDHSFDSSVRWVFSRPIAATTGFFETVRVRFTQAGELTVAGETTNFSGNLKEGLATDSRGILWELEEGIVGAFERPATVEASTRRILPELETVWK